MSDVAADELVVGGPRPLRGRLRVPGDKGISHRALLFAAMADGRSARSRTSPAATTSRRTAAALEQLGVADRTVDGAARSPSTAAASTGSREPDGVVDCGNSGTTMRMLAGLLAGRPFLSCSPATSRCVAAADGAGSSSRCGRWARTLDGRADGDAARRSSSGAARSHGCAPRARRRERPGEDRAACSPGCRPTGTTEIVEPAPSRDHTERMLGALGAPVDRVDDRTRARHRRRARRRSSSTVPGDPSSAAFFVVAATITPGSRARARGRRACNPARHRVRRRAAAHGRRASRSTPPAKRLGEPVGDSRVDARAAARHRRSRATRSRGASTSSRCSRSRPRSPTASPRSATRPSSGEGERPHRHASSELLTQLGVGGRDRAPTGSSSAAARRSRATARRATATTASRMAGGGRRRTRSTARPTVRGWRAVAIVVPRVRRRPRRAHRTARVTARRVVAIDGPSGSGKSTVARGVAAALGLPRARHRRDVPRGHARRARGRASTSTTPTRCAAVAARGRDRARATASRALDGRDVCDRDPRARGHRRGVDGVGAPAGARGARRPPAGVGATSTAAAWSRAATSAPSCSPTRRSRCSSPRATRCGPRRRQRDEAAAAARRRRRRGAATRSTGATAPTPRSGVPRGPKTRPPTRRRRHHRRDRRGCRRRRSSARVGAGRRAGGMTFYRFARGVVLERVQGRVPGAGRRQGARAARRARTSSPRRTGRSSTCPFAAFVTHAPVRFMAKEELFPAPLGRRLFDALGAVQVERGTADRGALRALEGGAASGASRSRCSPRARAHAGPRSRRCSTAPRTSR